MKPSRTLILALLVALYATSAGSQIVPAGDVFTINENAAGNQQAPRVAVGVDGVFVVVWRTEGSIEGRRLRGTEELIGGDFLVASPSAPVSTLALAVHDGGFAVAAPAVTDSAAFATCP